MPPAAKKQALEIVVLIIFYFVVLTFKYGAIYICSYQKGL